MIKHWQHTMVVSPKDYNNYKDHKIPLSPPKDINLPFNTAVFVNNDIGGKRLEGIYDPRIKSIRPLNNTTAPNKDLRLYLDAVTNENITILAVDGLMGSGKTSTVIEYIIDKYLKNISIPKNIEDFKLNLDIPKIMISKPHINAGGKHEDYGFLPGDIESKLDPKLSNFTQYFDRWHPCGFNKLQELGYIQILPLGFIRGLDAKNTILIADECQNTRELISMVTRKADNCRIFLLGDTSPFQIDLDRNNPKENGLTRIINLLQGASYFQYIEMKTIEHIVRSKEVKDIVKRLFKQYGENPQEWIV